MQKFPNIIQFKGFSKSGKTTIIESIIRYLKKKNFNISYVKSIHIDDFSIDTPGKNTWYMKKAGADPVVALSKNETAFITKERLSLESMIKINQIISNEQTQLKSNKLDYIIAEGFFDYKFPIVLTLKTQNDFQKLFEMITKKPDYVKIIRNIFCLSGVYVGKLEQKHLITQLRQEIEEIISKFSSNLSYNFTEELYEHLRRISIVNIKENPFKFLELYKKHKFQK